jgi:hypothetical protein
LIKPAGPWANTIDVPGGSVSYIVQYGFGLERIVAKGTTIAVNYLGTRGVDLFRSHDVNAPPPPLYLSRPDPAFGQIRQIDPRDDRPRSRCS